MYLSDAFPRRFARDDSVLDKAPLDKAPPSLEKASPREAGRANAELDAVRIDRRRLRPAKHARLSAPELARLARLLIAGGDDVVRDEIETRLAAGVPPLSVMNDVLAPIARELGRLWDRDDCDLIDVQRACGALQRLMGRIKPQGAARTLLKPPSILIRVAPGERHTLGADVAETVFRDLGWRVSRGAERGTGAELAREWYDFVGFSLGCDRHVESLSQAIAEARAASRNRRLLVVVGGAIFAERPDIARKIEADFCVCAAKIPVKHPNALVTGSAMSHAFHTRG